MKKIRYRLISLFLTFLLFLSACSGGQDSSASSASGTSGTDETTTSYEQVEQSVLEERARFDAFCEELFLEEVVADTITLHYTLTRPEDFGITEAEVTLGDISEAAHQEAVAELNGLRTTLQTFSTEDLTEEQCLTYDILSSYIETELSASDLYLYMEPLTPYTGLHVQLPVLLAEYDFNRLQDVEDYLLLLEDLPRYYADILTFEQAKAEAGLFMSDLLADQVITACNDFVAEPENNYLIEIFADKLEDFDELSSELREEYKARNKDLVLNSVIPAYGALAAGLETLKGTGTTNGGLVSLPEGKEYYTYLVRSGTGSDKTPDELITWLEESLSQDINRMALLLQTDATLMDSYMDFHFHIQNPEDILDELKVKITDDFPECPDVNSAVQYVHESLEESSSPAFYLTPPIDALEDQFIYVNGSAGGEDLYPTVAHEGYPGHLYQNVYFAAQDVNHLRHLLNFPGYSEGWATYVENLSYSYCEGTSDNMISLMQTSVAIDLKLSALADLYVNYEGFTETELADFLESTFGIDQKVSKKMYLLLVGDPGNYLSYVIGWMEIEEMRALAEGTLGDAFEAKAFHQFILDMGPAPYDVIGDHLQKWLAEQ